MKSADDYWSRYLDERPIVVAIAGPNGAGKSTFYEAHLRASGLRFVNADVLAKELGLEAYPAAQLAAVLRRELISRKESFVFETVLSDPAGEKVAFLKETANAGYRVVLCFIGIPNAGVSEQRVAMRVSQGGHDVPTEKLIARFPRTLRNLQRAVRELPCVLVFDNANLRDPYRHVATFTEGRRVFVRRPVPRWLKNVLPAAS